MQERHATAHLLLVLLTSSMRCAQLETAKLYDNLANDIDAMADDWLKMLSSSQAIAVCRDRPRKVNFKGQTGLSWTGAARASRVQSSSPGQTICWEYCLMRLSW